MRGMRNDEIHAAIILIAYSATALMHSINWLLMGATLAFATMILSRKKEVAEAGPYGGAANWITFGRLVILIIATWLVLDQSYIVYGSLILLIIIADGLDGYVARRFGLESKFGADFDMETDALLACLLSLVAYDQFDVSPLVPIAGILRYVFVFILRITRLYLTPAPPMPGARLIAVIFFISLITPYFIEPPLSGWSMEAAAALILFSFGREWYLRFSLKEEGVS